LHLVVTTSKPFVVSFVGPSGVGKTTLVESLVPLLAERGLRVGTIKHASHGFDVDRPGSDSFRHRKAGASTVLLFGPGGAVLFLDAPPSPALRQRQHHGPASSDGATGIGSLLTAHMSSLDVVLAEGFMPMSDRVVELNRVGVAPKDFEQGTTPWITVCDAPDRPESALGFDDAPHLAELIAGALEAP